MGVYSGARSCCCAYARLCCCAYARLCCCAYLVAMRRCLMGARAGTMARFRPTFNSPLVRSSAHPPRFRHYHPSSDSHSGLVWVSKAATERGLCSRREALAFIQQGRLFVNGERVEDPKIKVGPRDDVTLDDAATQQQGSLVTIVLNKPTGYVSSQPEPGETPSIQLLEPSAHFLFDPSHPAASTSSPSPKINPRKLAKLAVCGRLDKDSTGLLIFTQDGCVLHAHTFAHTGTHIRTGRVLGVLVYARTSFCALLAQPHV